MGLFHPGTLHILPTNEVLSILVNLTACLCHNASKIFTGKLVGAKIIAASMAHKTFEAGLGKGVEL